MRLMATAAADGAVVQLDLEATSTGAAKFTGVAGAKSWRATVAAGSS